MTDIPREAPAAGEAEREESAHVRQLRPGDLVDLFSRPRLFFSGGINLGGVRNLLPVVWITGIAAQIDRINAEILRHDFDVERATWALIEPIVTGPWAYFWAWVLGFGIVTGGLIYLIGGWWYRMRLVFSGSGEKTDKDLARQVYMFAGLVAALPSLLLAIGLNIYFPNYMAAYNSDELVSSFLPIFIFWSVAVSYVGARQSFSLTPWKARLWFLVLPALFYLLLIGAVLSLFSLFGEGF